MLSTVKGHTTGRAFSTSSTVIGSLRSALGLSAAHGGAVDVARGDAERLADGGRRMLAGREHAVHVGHLEPGVAHGVGDGFHVQRELALVGQRAHLVGLVHADDAGNIGEIAQVGHGAHRPAGLNSGSVTSSVSFWKTTSTGMSHVIFFGSGSAPIK